MSSSANRPTRTRPRVSGQVLAAVGAGVGPGDPLVRALATCVRQAHARRRFGTALD